MNSSVYPEESCNVSSKRRKLDWVMEVLKQFYAPFNQLSKVRLQEVMKLIRIIEMRSGELFQLRAAEDNDYLFVIEGKLEMVRIGSMQSISGPAGALAKAQVLPGNSSTTTLLARENSIACPGKVWRLHLNA